MKTLELNNIDQQLLDLALAEDLSVPCQDATTDALFGAAPNYYQAKIISKQPTSITIAGIEVIRALINKYDKTCKITTDFQDGQQLEPKGTLLKLAGSAHSLLALERTVLNFLRHLSAIATLTQQFVDKVKSTQLKILDTRKTTPGLRHLEKYAVHCGGGVNHRMGLYDAIMIKDTHVDLLGGLDVALLKLTDDITLPVIVEVRTKAELDTVLTHGENKVNRVLLDNMSLQDMADSVQACKNLFETEASGNITLERIGAIADTGVDYASVGCLTYAAGQVDLSMRSIK